MSKYTHSLESIIYFQCRVIPGKIYVYAINSDALVLKYCIDAEPGTGPSDYFVFDSSSHHTVTLRHKSTIKSITLQ